MKLFVSCFLLLCNSQFSICEENTEQRTLRIVLKEMKRQFEETREHQAKQEIRILELEKDKWYRELEHDMWIREFEKKNGILGQEQNNRIYKLEHNIKIQSKHMEVLRNKYIRRENDTPMFKLNNAMILSKQNMTVSKTSEENLKLTAKDGISVNVTKHFNDRRCGKNGEMSTKKTSSEY